MTPEKVGRYEIQREIGWGGMAVVYLARDPVMDRPVAVKVLPRQLTFDHRFHERFRREARAVANMMHPAIVPVFDFGEDDGQLFLVMPYMSGGSLRERLRQGPLPLIEAARIISELAPGLDAAHRRGLIHRDLKPANILFDEWDRPYLADFGIAKLIEDSDTALTMTGGLVGTPAYMSPEQAMAIKELDGRSDLYALGVIFFQMITGHTPFMAETPLGIIMKHVSEPVPHVAEEDPTLPSGTQAILDKAMAKDREARYDTATRLAGAIAGLAAALTPAPPAAEVRTTPEVRAPAVPDLAVAQPFSSATTSPMDAATALDKAPPSLAPAPEEIPTDVIKESHPASTPGGTMAIEPIGNVPRQPDLGGPQPDRSPPAKRAGPRVAAAAVAIVVVLVIVAGAAYLLSSRPGLLDRILGSPAAPEPPEVESAGQEWQWPATGITMVGVPGGTFMMGSSSLDFEAFAEEQPRHQVNLHPFWIGKTEVTNAQYQQCVEDGACGPSHFADDPDLNGPDQPVVGVTWSDADNFCTWAGGQLPTEAQWEFAARGPRSLTYPWGVSISDERLNFCDSNCSMMARDRNSDDGYQLTAPVGQYPSGSSWVGALDMAGNVWEWVADWYAKDYYDRSPADNPAGPGSGRDKVLRGGSWAESARSQRSAFRKNYVTYATTSHIGFRCLKPAPFSPAG